VYLIHRRDTLRVTKIYHEPLQKTENVEFVWNSQVTQLHSNGKLSGVTVKDVNSGEERLLEVDGLFVSIGRSPATAPFAAQLQLDEKGYIVADESTMTKLPGVYAVGDVRTKAVRQIVTATADGAVAAHYAEEYLLGANP
jgi:thioredoxin reductase (NADPH)